MTAIAEDARVYRWREKKEGARTCLEREISNDKGTSLLGLARLAASHGPAQIFPGSLLESQFGNADVLCYPVPAGVKSRC